MMIESTHIYFTSGWKYQLDASFHYRLKNAFSVTVEYSGPYYSIYQANGGWWITAHRGCCWDGPTWYPDFDWTMAPSLVHDILHWLIQKGVIPEAENNLIDKELEDAVLNSKQDIHWIQGGNASRRIRARSLRRATNLVNELVGAAKEIYVVAV